MKTSRRGGELVISMSPCRALFHFRAVLDQQLLQHRAVAMALVLAVTADREISAVRQHRKQSQIVLGRRLFHLRLVSLYERVPLPWRICRQPELHCLEAWSQVREPHVIPVLLCEL